jgi:phosphatidylglycerol:prolipoprotein diacylglycerol transferase
VFEIGPFAMSWHGFWSFIGILVAVYLVVRWSKRDGINTDIAYDVALWGILGGIIGARLMLVFELGYIFTIIFRSYK